MNPSLILVGISLFVWGIGESMFFIFQPIYLQQLGADPILIGAILGTAGICMTVAHIPAGYLADRIGQRPLIWSAWLIGLVSVGLMAIAQDLPSFTTGLLAYSLTTFVVSPLNSYVSEQRGNMSVGRAISLSSSAFNFGAVIGPILGGFIGDTHGLKAVFFLSTCIIVASTILIFFIKPLPPVKQSQENRHGLLLTNRLFWSYLLVVFFVILSVTLPQPLTPNFLQNQRGLSLTLIGQIGAAGNLGNAVIALGMGAIRPHVALLLGQGLVAIFAALLWIGTSPLWYAVGYFCLGGYRLVRLMATTQVRALVKSGQVGLAYGIAETATGLAFILAPPIAGLVYNHNPWWVYPISLIFILATAGIYYQLSPQLFKTATQAESSSNKKMEKINAA